jgi:hypothetical protein
MNFRMAVGKSDSSSPIMVIRWNVHPAIAPRLIREVAYVVDAIWMLVHVNPCLGRAWISQSGGFGCVTREGSGIPSIRVIPNPYVSGNTPYPFGVAGALLSSTQKYI